MPVRRALVRDTAVLVTENFGNSRSGIIQLGAPNSRDPGCRCEPLQNKLASPVIFERFRKFTETRLCIADGDVHIGQIALPAGIQSVRRNDPGNEAKALIITLERLVDVSLGK
jgi:hypothetical protein